MCLSLNQDWVEQNLNTLLKTLEADFDPHLKRISSDHLKIITSEYNDIGDVILVFETTVLEFGSCSGVRQTYYQNRKIKIQSGEAPLSDRLIVLF